MIKICITLSLFCALISTVFSQDLETNNKCVYTLSKAVFTCVGLTSVDKNIEKFILKDTHMLIIKNTTIAEFKTGHHDNNNYKNLVSYNIVNNNKVIIEKNAFSGLSNLNYLKISENGDFNRIDDNTFVGLKRLEILNLEKNEIRAVLPGALRDLDNLITLTIADNKLTVIYAKTFEFLANLKTLLLGHNQIEIIESDAFLGLTSLELLDLSRNRIRKINANEFNKLSTSLRTLYLGFNKIDNIEGDLQLQHLQFLEMQQNNLREIGDNVFKQSQELTSVDLSNNRDLEVREKPFLHLVSLRLLNLKNCRGKLEDFVALQKNISLIL